MKKVLITTYTEVPITTPDNTQLEKEAREYATTEINGHLPWKQVNEERRTSFLAGANTQTGWKISGRK